MGGKVDTVELTRGASAVEEMSWALLALEFVSPVMNLYLYLHLHTSFLYLYKGVH